MRIFANLLFLTSMLSACDPAFDPWAGWDETGDTGEAPESPGLQEHDPCLVVGDVIGQSLVASDPTPGMSALGWTFPTASVPGMGAKPNDIDPDPNELTSGWSWVWSMSPPPLDVPARTSASFLGLPVDDIGAFASHVFVVTSTTDGLSAVELRYLVDHGGTWDGTLHPTGVDVPGGSTVWYLDLGALPDNTSLARWFLHGALTQGYTSGAPHDVVASGGSTVDTSVLNAFPWGGTQKYLLRDGVAFVPSMGYCETAGGGADG